VKFVVILVLVAGVILAVYLRMTNQSKNSAKQAEENMTETQTLKMYDMEAQYPKTARDVVKMHCRLLKCMYNEDLSDDEYQQLNGQARQLFSAELLESNPESTQLSDLMKDVEEFQSAGKIYISYTVDSEDNVMYSTVDSKEYAMVLVTCNIKESTVTNAIEEEYLLCKEDGNWKIVGWEGLQTDDTSETED
jgi:hypothetical protein